MSVYVFVQYRMKPGVSAKDYVERMGRFPVPESPGWLDSKTFVIDKEFVHTHQPAREPQSHILEMHEWESWDHWMKHLESDGMEEALKTYYEMVDKESKFMWQSNEKPVWIC